MGPCQSKYIVSMQGSRKFRRGGGGGVGMGDGVCVCVRGGGAGPENVF